MTIEWFRDLVVCIFGLGVTVVVIFIAVLAFLLYRRLRPILDSVKTTTKTVENLSSCVEVEVARPLTHDLLQQSIDKLDAKVSHILVNDLHDDTFYARIVMDRDGERIELDSRPSDAIALAVRVEAPIYCAEQVLEAAADLGLLKQRSDFSESEDLQKWLEDLKPDDFGKYKM